nr:carboxypeptidase-like regulatory domain-containing protein [uncultured Fluviicola sp.]
MYLNPAKYRINHSKISLSFFFLACLIVHTGAWSQVEAIIKGKVINESGDPVKNAAVKLGRNDAKTNASGIFIVRNTEFPAQLTVSHALYSQYMDMVVLPENWRDTVHLVVLLTGKETQLDEVTVTSEQVFWVYPKKEANILDFILQPDAGIVLCCSDERNYFVRGLDYNGKKLFETPIPQHPEQLYRDCMESIYLVYSDSMFETAMVNNSLGFFEPKPILGVLDLLRSLVYKDSKNLIKYTYSKDDQCIEYSAINLQSKRVKSLYIGEKLTRNRELREYKDENHADGNEKLHAKSSEELRLIRIRWNNKQFYEQILRDPVYIPMFELNDSLIIFDHLNDSAIVFTKSGNRVRSFPIYYHYYTGWKKELISNQEKTRIYAAYESPDGLTTLREINPSTGKAINVNVLEKHIYPAHIQIRGNFAYYLYKQYLGSTFNYLYKQPLKE